VRDYTQAALAGDMDRATEISRSINPLRALRARRKRIMTKPKGENEL
jgi:hypothetical protein